MTKRWVSITSYRDHLIAITEDGEIWRIDIDEFTEQRMKFTKLGDLPRELPAYG